MDTKVDEVYYLPVIVEAFSREVKGFSFPVPYDTTAFWLERDYHSKEYLESYVHFIQNPTWYTGYYFDAFHSSDIKNKTIPERIDEIEDILNGEYNIKLYHWRKEGPDKNSFEMLKDLLKLEISHFRYDGKDAGHGCLCVACGIIYTVVKVGDKWTVLNDGKIVHQVQLKAE